MRKLARVLFLLSSAAWLASCVDDTSDDITSTPTSPGPTDPIARCATLEPTADQIAVVNAQLDATRRNRDPSLLGGPAVTVPVRWHVIHKGATGRLTATTINSQIDVLNDS